MTDRTLRRLVHDLRDTLSTMLTRLELLRERVPAAEPDADALVADVRAIVRLLDDATGTEAAPVGPIWDDDNHAVLRGRRVLQVDDDDDSASPVRAVFVGLAGTEVAHARTGDDALAIVAAGDVDLALVDWWLEQSDASAVVAALAKRGVPTVVLSGDDEAEQHARRHGATFVLKPAPLRSVLDAAARAVRAESF